MKTKKKKPETVAKTSTEYLQNVVDRQMDFLKSYKIRQDDVVRGLGRVKAALGAGSLEAAKAALEELLSRDLKQAKDRQDNHAFALDIAIKGLEEAKNHLDGGYALAANDALSQMEILVPEAFEKAPPAGAAS